MIIIKKKKLMIITSLTLFILVLFIIKEVSSMSHYQIVNFSTGIVTAGTLNVRQGPSTSYKIVTQVHKNEYIRVFAQIGKWYVVQVEGDYIGAVSKDYVKPIYASSNGGASDNNGEITTVLSEDEKEVFNLINLQRTNAGLSALVINDELQNVARIKARDMVQNNYFSHTSPTYGTPFEMIKSFGISYKTAGENIAGNSSNSGAVSAWMNSEGHKANILNTSYNQTGIGVVSSSKYGKIFVQLFIGK